MNAIEARAILMQRMEEIADQDYPIPWVGEMIEETPEGFYFEGTIHKKDENPIDDCAHWFVDKTTGLCQMNIEWGPSPA